MHAAELLLRCLPLRTYAVQMLAPCAIELSSFGLQAHDFDAIKSFGGSTGAGAGTPGPSLEGPMYTTTCR
jgi:hypothetical protein